MILYRYILRSHIGPFLFAFVTVVFLFIFQFVYKTIDQLIGKGLSMWVIAQLIGYNMAWIVTLAVPMAVLVAALMAFGTLASDNEITVMKASGISLFKMMSPVLIISVILFYLMVLFNNEVLPEANHQARVLLGDISRTKPTLILEPGKFSEDVGGAKILVRKTFPNSNDLEGIYIYDYSNPNTKNLFTAKSGDISFTNDFRNIVMNLEDGEIHQLNIIDPSQRYRIVKFERHRIILNSEGFGFHQTGEGSLIRGDRELSADSMRSITDSLRVQLSNMNDNFINQLSGELKSLSTLKFSDTVFKRDITVIDSAGVEVFKGPDPVVNTYLNFITKKDQSRGLKLSQQNLQSQIYRYQVEIFKKYSIPFACVVFVLIGAPLGYRVKKGGFGIASGLSLLFFLLYWASLIGGEKLADRGMLSPFTGMWIANIVLGIFGLYLMFKSS